MDRWVTCFTWEFLAPPISRRTMSSCLKLPCGIDSSSLPGAAASSSSSTSSSSSCSGRPQSSLRLQPEVQRVTVAILGARGVGKTALVRQFVRCEFLEDHERNKPTQTYFTSIIVNERIYEVDLATDTCSGNVSQRTCMTLCSSVSYHTCIHSSVPEHTCVYTAMFQLTPVCIAMSQYTCMYSNVWYNNTNISSYLRDIDSVKNNLLKRSCKMHNALSVRCNSLS